MTKGPPDAYPAALFDARVAPVRGLRRLGDIHLARETANARISFPTGIIFIAWNAMPSPPLNRHPTPLGAWPRRISWASFCGLSSAASLAGSPA